MGRIQASDLPIPGIVSHQVHRSSAGNLENFERLGDDLRDSLIIIWEVRPCDLIVVCPAGLSTY